MRTKLKIIREQGKIFLIRFTIYFKVKSIKIHLILNDDKGKAHSHPWDFKSLLLIPYKETLYRKKRFNNSLSPRTTVDVVDKKINHKLFTIVNRTMNQKHLVSLYRIFSIKIPAITIGIYSEKKQLCSLCQEAGYCKSNKK